MILTLSKKIVVLNLTRSRKENRFGYNRNIPNSVYTYVVSNLKVTFWKTENRIESKKNFYAEIEEYYIGICNNRIPNKLLTEINEKVTDKIYDDYKQFWKQYPKSRKRYSKLKLEDLKHDFVYFLITEFLKKSEPNEYRSFSKILLNMNDEEFDKYEERKHWYENK